MILNGTISSLTTVIPVKLDILPPSLITQPFEQKEISVLIGLVGGIKGRLIIDTTKDVISTIGQSMFGMAIEGEMLESFAGELGNMIAGTLSTCISKYEIEMDITPPSVLVGELKIYGFENAFRLPIIIQNVGNMAIILMIE